MIIFRYYIKHNNGIFNNHLKDIDKIKTLTNKLLRGEVVVKNIKQQCLAFQKLYLADIKLNMTIIKFNNCNDSINSYIDNIVKTCTAMDINYHINTLDALTITETQFIDMIKSLNEQSAIHGYIIPLPLPFTINMNNIYQSIAPLKDVDGCSLINLGQLIKQQPPLIVPATAAAVLRLINHYQIKLINTYVVIVGASMQVGKPLANLL